MQPPADLDATVKHSTTLQLKGAIYSYTNINTTIICTHRRAIYQAVFLVGGEEEKEDEDKKEVKTMTKPHAMALLMLIIQIKLLRTRALHKTNSLSVRLELTLSTAFSNKRRTYDN